MTMKHTYIILFFLSSIVFSACNKDDDFSPKNYEKNIIGEWKQVHEYYWEHTEGRDPTERERDLNLNSSYIYKEGGVFYYKNHSFLQEERWKIVDGRIVINDDYETAEKILSLTQTELKTEVHFMDVNGNKPQEVYYLNTYERQ